jgi:hypothetical protein
MAHLLDWQFRLNHEDIRIAGGKIFGIFHPVYQRIRLNPAYFNSNLPCPVEDRVATPIEDAAWVLAQHAQIFENEPRVI